MKATINSGICMTFFLILSAHIWDGANSAAEPYSRDDAVVWLKLLVLCCHEGPSMHLASTHISVSSDRNTRVPSWCDTLRSSAGFIVYFKVVEYCSKCVRDTVNVPFEIWLCWPLGCKTLLIHCRSKALTRITNDAENSTDYASLISVV